MNEILSNLVEHEDVPLHPSLVSFLHPHPRSAILPSIGDPSIRTPNGADELGEKLPKDHRHPLSSRLDGAALQVLLVSPPSFFSATVIEVLRQIDADSDISQVAQLPTAALEKLQSPSLALIDLDAFPANGEALIRQISMKNGTAIVALSNSLDHKSIDLALDAGAVGYLPKTYTRPLIEGVLRLVIGGERYRPHDSSKERKRAGRPPKSSQPDAPAADTISGLTSRQKDVLLEVARGFTNLDIGKRLDMREGTVKTHLYAIYRKLNVHNRASAALFAARMAEVRHEQIAEAEQGKLNLSWLQPEMSHRRVRAGQCIFRLGDIGSELFYVQRGTVNLPEIGVTIGPGEVFGEIGIFTPEHKRTCSARCETDVDLFSLSSGQVRRIYFGNPQFAFFILMLVATRLMADCQRSNR